jgi:hypothetical protein
MRISCSAAFFADHFEAGLIGKGDQLPYHNNNL